MSETKLGTTPAEGAQRDAIHIAIAPVEALVDLRPGQSVGLEDGKARPTMASGKGVGIVDPFRRANVAAGERFWLLLHQNTIVGMRHHWSHPDFSDAPPSESRAPMSEAWLRRFAREHWHDNYDAMMEEAKDGDLCFGETDYPDSTSDEFWIHYSAVTGRSVKGYFRCAC